MNVHSERRFNLVDENWIPVAEKGLVSLSRVFSDSSLTALGGNPVEKIALLKLFLAIAQRAFTPKDEAEWKAEGPKGLSESALSYLNEKKDLFWLYGDKPFLQMPLISKAAVQSYGAVFPDIATGNTTVLLQSQVEKQLSDPEKALLVVTLSGFAMGGKKTDNSIVLSHGYTRKSNEKGKPSTGKPGPSLGFLGYLHSFLMGRSLAETLWLNIMTGDQISQMLQFEAGLGVPPWELMPEGEACTISKNLTQSIMGRLVPLCRFLLLTDQGIHYSEGIVHPTHKEGGFDLSIAVDLSDTPKAVWVDPEKRPWRQLTSLLSFFEAERNNRSFDCAQIRLGVLRARKAVPGFSIWSGGLRVSSNAGEQYPGGGDDFVESETYLFGEWLGKLWFEKLKSEMTALEDMAKVIFSAVSGYYGTQKMDGKNKAETAQNLFWQQCEKKFQDLVDACGDENDEKRLALRSVFIRYVDTAYNYVCPKETARQIDSWARHRPNLGRFIK